MSAYTDEQRAAARELQDMFNKSGTNTNKSRGGRRGGSASLASARGFLQHPTPGRGRVGSPMAQGPTRGATISSRLTGTTIHKPAVKSTTSVPTAKQANNPARIAQVTIPPAPPAPPVRPINRATPGSGSGPALSPRIANRQTAAPAPPTKPSNIPSTAGNSGPELVTQSINVQPVPVVSHPKPMIALVNLGVLAAPKHSSQPGTATSLPQSVPQGTIPKAVPATHSLVGAAAEASALQQSSYSPMGVDNFEVKPCRPASLAGNTLDAFGGRKDTTLNPFAATFTPSGMKTKSGLMNCDNPALASYPHLVKVEVTDDGRTTLVDTLNGPITWEWQSGLPPQHRADDDEPKTPKVDDRPKAQKVDFGFRAFATSKKDLSVGLLPKQVDDSTLPGRRPITEAYYQSKPVPLPVSPLHPVADEYYQPKPAPLPVSAIRPVTEEDHRLKLAPLSVAPLSSTTNETPKEHKMVEEKPICTCKPNQTIKGLAGSRFSRAGAPAVRNENMFTGACPVHFEESLLEYTAPAMTLSRPF